MKVKILQLLNSGKQKSILELELKNKKNVVTMSTNKRFEQIVKKQSIKNVKGKSFKFSDGLPFLKTLLFHYRTAYLIAIKVS